MLVLVPPDLPWQVAFIAALRNQTVTWGGSANLLVPWSADIHENPLFWEIVRAQDPDLIITSPGSLADYADLQPELFARAVTHERDGWLSQGVSEEAIRPLLDELVGTAFNDLDYEASAAVRSAVRTRLSPFHWGDDAFATASTTTHPAHDSLVDARKLTSGAPSELRVPQGVMAWSERLAVAAAVGDLSDIARRQLGAVGEIRVADLPVRSGFEAARLAARTPPLSDAAYPFEISDIGLQWARFGYAFDPVSIVVGDAPWDFALFYALRRLTSQAYWLPGEWALDPHHLASIRMLVRQHQRDPAVMARVLSVSAPDLARQVAAQLASDARQPASQWPFQDWRGAFPTNPARLFCQESMRASQSLVMHDGLSAIVNTPVPDVRTQDPLDMDWVVDVRLDGWAPTQDPDLGTHLVAGGEHPSTHVRASQGGVSYRATGWFRAAGVPLRAQLLAPQIKPLDLLAQLQVIARPSGFEVRLSDKGIYADETAELCGGANRLSTLLSDPDAFGALRNLALDGVGACRQVDQRWVWTYPQAAQLVEALGLGTLSDLVSRGVLWRGLVHKCSRCLREQWVETGDLTGQLRCARCRAQIEPNAGQWFGSSEQDPPSWLLRVNEMVWQFLDNDGDIPFRAAQTFTEHATPRQPADVSYEVELVQDDKKVAELDFCATWNGQLTLGEAKVNDRLDKTEAEERRALAKLREAASILRADRIILATACEQWRPATAQLAREVIPGPWPDLTLTSVRRPA